MILQENITTIPSLELDRLVITASCQPILIQLHVSLTLEYDLLGGAKYINISIPRIGITIPNELNGLTQSNSWICLNVWLSH